MQNNFNNGSYYYPPISDSKLEQMAYYEQKRKAEKSELIRTGILIGIAILAYVMIQTIISGIVLKGELKELYQTSSIFNNSFVMIASHFCSVLLPFGLMALILRKQFISPVIPAEKIEKPRLFAWVGFGMGLCVISNYIVNFITIICKEFGYELTKGENIKPDSVLACVVAVFATAIVPPVIEEFAMRCCTLGVLKKYGKGFAVVTVSVVFGLLHGNVIQFIFAFLIGLVLAIVTIKTDSILPAILIHAFNNGISVTSDVANYISGKDISKTVVGVLFYGWLALGVFGFLYLFTHKEFKFGKISRQPKEPYALSIGTKVACLIPGFILPFFMLIFITLSTIKKI